MDKRTFLKHLATIIPATAILPSAVLQSCKKDKLPNTSFDGKVIIIGAGAAGMYAAYLLKERDIDVTILEASGRRGGRIRTLKDFSDFDIELGAEEVHGQKSSFYDLIQGTNAEFVSADTTDYMFIDNILHTEDTISGDLDYEAAWDLINEIENYSGSDILAIDYIQQNGISNRMHKLLNAVIGNEHGTSNNRVNIKGIALEENQWTAGNQNFLIRNRSILSIFEERFASILNDIQLNTAVSNIDYSGEQIKITDSSGGTHMADKVILTVPVTVLKDRDISFTPELPLAKTQALTNIGMGAGMKIIMKFNNRFWDANAGSIYGNGFIPEFWSTGVGERSTANNILTAFVHGENAEYLSSIGNNAVNTATNELDLMYGVGVASNSLSKFHIMDWFKEPYIKGTYSYPTIGEGTARQQLAIPLNDKLFFAGEATHFEGHFGTVHGAMETGLRAVDDLLQTIEE